MTNDLIIDYGDTTNCEGISSPEGVVSLWQQDCSATNRDRLPGKLGNVCIERKLTHKSTRYNGRFEEIEIARP